MITALNWALGPYRIAQEIDRGQFGTVYEATDAHGSQIALKLVPVQGADSEEKVSAERQGAALQQRFSRTYKNLVPEVLDHQRIDPYYAIAMELVRGEPLTSIINAGRISAERAATIALAICNFLEKAHAFTATNDDQPESLIVHGDLKPAHILLLPDGSIRVLDFGIAKALAARKAATTNKWGSVDYASPERLESGRVNEQVDFWSLGVMLFEMVSGFRPYLRYEHNQSRLETAIRRQEPRLPMPVDADPRLVAVVDKLLAPQIERRYQSAREIATDLQAFLKSEPVAAAAEAARADQATVRMPMPVPVPVIPRSESTIGTDPLPPLPGAQGSTSSQGEQRVVPTEALPKSAPVPPLPPLPLPPAAARTRSNKPWTAAILSMIVPGIGQLYNGDILRGIFWLVVTPGFWIGTGGALGWPFHFVSAYSAYQRALRKAAPVVQATRPSRRLSFLRPRAPILLLVVGALLVPEWLSLVRAQQLRERAHSFEISDLGAVRAAFRRVGRTPFGFGAALVSEPLKDRLVDLADRTILEFRAETPALVRDDWVHARDSLDLATEVTPSDARVAAKRQYVLGRLAWMDADDRADVDRAMRLLRDSARLDPTSPDPYLGLATIHAYSTRDLMALTQAIEDAEARGYTRGRRERAELGDVNKILGDRARTEARRLSGNERIDRLQRAADNYTQCAEQLEGLHLGASERVLSDCRRRLAAVREEVDRERVRQLEPIFLLPFFGV